MPYSVGDMEVLWDQLGSRIPIAVRNATSESLSTNSSVLNLSSVVNLGGRAAGSSSSGPSDGLFLGASFGSDASPNGSCIEISIVNTGHLPVRFSAAMAAATSLDSRMASFMDC